MSGILRRMTPHATVAAAQAMLGITILAFVPLVLLTLLRPLRETRRR